MSSSESEAPARSPRWKRIANTVLLAVIAGALWVAWPQSLSGDIAYVKVQGHSMDGTYKTGDLIIVRRQTRYANRDIIAYRIPKGEFGAGAQVIHRIVGGNGKTGFITKGDNRPVIDAWHPRTGDVVGHSWIRIVGAGTWFSRLSQPLPLGVLVSGLTVFVMVLPSSKGQSKTPTEAPERDDQAERRQRRRRRPRVRDPITAPIDLSDISDQSANQESAEPVLNADPMEKMDANEPALATDAIEPTLPIDKMDPREPIDSSESCDHSDHLEPLERLSVLLMHSSSRGPGSLFYAPRMLYRQVRPLPAGTDPSSLEKADQLT